MIIKIKADAVDLTIDGIDGDLLLKILASQTVTSGPGEKVTKPAAVPADIYETLKGQLGRTMDANRDTPQSRAEPLADVDPDAVDESLLTDNQREVLRFVRAAARGRWLAEEFVKCADVTVRGLAEGAGVSENTCYKIMKRLTELGLIKYQGKQQPIVVF